MYLDVDIAIQPRNGASYPFSLRAPGGDASGSFIFPDDSEFQHLIARLYALDSDEAGLTQLGRRLFATLFSGQARDVLARSQGMLTAGQRLRLRLSISAEEGKLAALPWELLDDPDGGAVALTEMPIVRYLPVAIRVPTVAASLPLKVLLTGAAADTAAVQPVLDEIQLALASLGSHAQVTVEPQLTLPMFQRRLREGFHIWHFVGQGGLSESGQASTLLFSDGGQGLKSVGASQLAVLLGSSGVRLVVLDASAGTRLATDSFRMIAPALMKTQIPTVIGMQFSAPTEASQAFAGEFYRALAEGLPIDTCVTEGRRSVMGVAGLDRPDWATPVVYSRAPDNQLFAVPQADLPGKITTLASAPGLPANTAVSVHSDYGTLLNAGAPPLVTRLAERPRPPRPPRSFFNRERELRTLIDELQPRQGAWVRGPAGAGITALLRRIANTEAARAMPDGVVTLNSSFEPADAGDAVQELFDRYYSSTTPAKLTLDAAKSYLGGLRALFVFDRLPLPADELTELSDILAEGSVLIAAEGYAPDTLADVVLGALPRQEATRLIGGEAAAEIDLTNVMFLDRICTALGDMPMALQLAGRLLQTNTVPLKQLVALAEEQTAEPVALARAARITLQALDEAQTQVLAALVRGGPSGLKVDAITTICQIDASVIDAALERLCNLRLAEAGNDRYTPSTQSLGRVLDRLIKPGDQKRHAAAFFAAAAALHVGNLQWLAGEEGNLVQAIQTLLDQGQAEQAGKLIKTLQPAAVLQGKWGLWSRLINQAERAAAADPSLRAWVQHERGSRAALLGDRAAAQAALTQAAQLRTAANDAIGASFSQHNLRHLGVLPALPASPAATSAAVGRPPRMFAALGGALLLALIGLLLYTSGAFSGGAATPAIAPAVTLATNQPQIVAPPSTASVPTLVKPTDAPTKAATPSALPTSITAEASPSSVPLVCQIVAAQVNVRSGPATTFRVLGALTDGDQVTPLGRSADSQWLQVQTAQLGSGWLSSNQSLVRCTSDIGLLPLINASAGPTPTKRPRPSATPTVTQVPATATPTTLPTLTSSLVPTLLPSATATVSATPRLTSTPTPVPTLTPTQTPLPTLTHTPVPTLTYTLVPTLTYTPSPTETPTPTLIPTRTFTPTLTSIPTRTSTPTATLTPTYGLPLTSITPFPSPTP